MSTIHRALKKAQKEKDAHHLEYEGVLQGRKRMDRFSIKYLWWISIPLVVCILAFLSYSWFFSGDRRPPVSEKSDREKAMTVPIEGQPVASAVKKGIVEKETVVDAKELYDKAMAFHKSRRFMDAKRLYQETLKADPNYVDALNNLGVIFLHEKNYEAARNSLEQASRVSPNSVDPHYNLACVFALKGDPDQALTHLKLAYTLNSEVKKWARDDSDLKNLQGLPEFEEFVRTDESQ